MSTKPVTITLKQKFAVGNRLREVLTELPDGLWEYKPQYDDGVIAGEFSIPKHLVQSVRKRAFGPLFEAVKTKAKKDEVTADIFRRLKRLEDWAHRMDPTWNTLKPKE